VSHSLVLQCGIGAPNAWGRTNPPTVISFPIFLNESADFFGCCFRLCMAKNHKSLIAKSFLIWGVVEANFNPYSVAVVKLKNPQHSTQHGCTSAC
jgi:hypothetical protein